MNIKYFKRLSNCLLALLVICSCTSNYFPKPSSYLSLQYPSPIYEFVEDSCYLKFKLNTKAALLKSENCTVNILYPKLKATVYLSYKEINNNFDSLLNDAYQLPTKHLIKADQIPEKLFINPQNRVYGTLFNIVGDAASQSQFFLTDSTQHFLVGSLYFYSRPNYDSIYPAAHYIQSDMVKLMESLEWQNSK